MAWCETNRRWYNCDDPSCSLSPESVGVCKSNPELTEHCFCDNPMAITVDASGNTLLFDLYRHHDRFDRGLSRSMKEAKDRMPVVERREGDAMTTARTHANTETDNILQATFNEAYNYVDWGQPGRLRNRKEAGCIRMSPKNGLGAVTRDHGCNRGPGKYRNWNFHRV